MKNLFRYALAGCLLAALTVSAQLDRSKVPTPGPAPAVSFPDYDLVQTTNGIRVILVKDSKLPTLSLRLLIDRKPVREAEFAGGLGIMGEMLVHGTATRTKDQLDEEIDFIGARLGSAGTSVFASGLSRYTERIFGLAADVALHPTFPKDELDKVLTQAISGLKHRKMEPNAIVEVVRKRVLYGDAHPYGDIETEETVGKITREKCLELYATYFKPNQAILAVVGDLDKPQVLKLIDRYFGAWKPGPLLAPDYAAPKPLTGIQVAFVDRSSSVQSVIRIGQTVHLPWTSPDVTAVEVMNTILGGGASFRLFTNLREAHAYTYGANSSIGPDEMVSAFTASTSAKNPVTDGAITEMFNEIKRIRDEPVTAAELDRAKNYISGGFVRGLESADNVASHAIVIERYGLPKDHYKTFLKRVAAVSAADVQRVAKQYLQPNQMLIDVVGAAKEVKDKLKSFGTLTTYDEDGRPLVDKSASAIKLTAAEVLDKFMAKTGGQAKLDALRDQSLEFSGKLANFDVKLKSVRKAPNKLYQEMAIGPMRQPTGFDGEKGWAVTPQGPLELSGEQLEAMKADVPINFYTAYARLGYQAEVTGLKPIKGKDCYEVTFSKAAAPTLRHYFSAEDFLKVREVTTMTSPSPPGEQSTDLFDYKDFQGYSIPTRIEVTMMGQVLTATLDKCQINTGVDDKMFRKPDGK